MHESVLIVEMPELSNESVFAMCAFLHTLIASFESHYDHQLRKCYRQMEEEQHQKWQERCQQSSQP